MNQTIFAKSLSVISISSLLIMMFSHAAPRNPSAQSGDATHKEDTRKPTLTEFQKEILKCLPQLKQVEGLRAFDGLVDSISSQFLLLDEHNLYREVQFEREGKVQKLKRTRDQVELFDVDLEGRLTAVPFKVDPKAKSPSNQIGQILHRAKVIADWQKTRETREGSLTIDLVRKDGRIEQVLVENRKLKSRLDCNTLANSQICLCHK